MGWGVAFGRCGQAAGRTRSASSKRGAVTVPTLYSDFCCNATMAFTHPTGFRLRACLVRCECRDDPVFMRFSSCVLASRRRCTFAEKSACIPVSPGSPTRPIVSAGVVADKQKGRPSPSGWMNERMEDPRPGCVFSGSDSSAVAARLGAPDALDHFRAGRSRKGKAEGMRSTGRKALSDLRFEMVFRSTGGLLRRERKRVPPTTREVRRARG